MSNIIMCRYTKGEYFPADFLYKQELFGFDVA
jgi:hypothetical protein